MGKTFVLMAQAIAILMASCQAIDDRKIPSSKPIEAVKANIRSFVDYIAKDRVIYPDMRKMKEFVQSIKSEILVFPELATSGYYFTDRNQLMGIADEFESTTIQQFQKLSTELKKVIIFGFGILNYGLKFNYINNELS